MKSPQALAQQLARQWHAAQFREQRLLGGPQAWPLRLAIGMPANRDFLGNDGRLARHLEAWRSVQQRGPGCVIWESRKYRGGGDAIEVPTAWVLDKPSVWVAATRDPVVQAQYRTLLALLGAVDACFHRLLVRRAMLWRDTPLAQVIEAARIAMQLQPGCAAGLPLRALAVAGNDSKFFERHAGLLRALLDARFDGEASRQGLAAFLDADEAQAHWLLVVPLAEGLLPFGRLRLAASDLAQTALPASHLLIVENERSLHQLPTPLPDTIAILGAGRNLGWMAGAWLRERRLAYWGDMDTWGLSMLAVARRHQPHLQALLMDEQTFARHEALAVREEAHASVELLAGLWPEELAFYRYLTGRERGRLEQEFLPPQVVAQVLRQWRGSSQEQMPCML